jgi:surface antigen
MERFRLCWRLRRFAAGAAFVGIFGAAGCSLPLDSMFTRSEADVEHTGSTSRSVDQATQFADSASPSEIDLAYARAAAAEALARGGKDSSTPWVNPKTGAGGNITPLAAAYGQGAAVCREFLASYVRGQAQAWMQGEACRTEHGEWQVKALKPLKQG